MSSPSSRSSFQNQKGIRPNWRGGSKKREKEHSRSKVGSPLRRLKEMAGKQVKIEGRGVSRMEEEELDLTGAGTYHRCL